MGTRNTYIIAGSNGSGKTTFAETFLPLYAKCPNFINADLIAKGLSPFNPRSAALKAGRLVLEQIDDFARRGEDFAFESTLSGKSYANLLARLKTQNYKLHFFYLWIPNPDLAITRIKGRIAEGGHSVPPDDIRRRFSRSLGNFIKLYKPLADTWMLFDNSGPRPQLVAGIVNNQEVVFIETSFRNILKAGDAR